MLVGVIKSTQGQSSTENYAWLALALVSAFGIYGCVQFIRGKSAKLLMLALALGVASTCIGLDRLAARPADARRPGSDHQSTSNRQDLDDSDVEIKPFEERIDTQKIELGVVADRRLCRAVALPDVAAGQEVHLPLSTRSTACNRRCSRARERRQAPTRSFDSDSRSDGVR